MPAKLFISYSHDSEEHADRVLALANQLREDGYDCLIDQYDTAQGWTQWMTYSADFTIIEQGQTLKPTAEQMRKHHKQHWQAAEQLIDQTGYHRRDKVLAKLKPS